MTKRKFTLKDYRQLIDDKLNPYFENLKVTHDIEELTKAQGVDEALPLTQELEEV